MSAFVDHVKQKNFESTLRYVEDIYKKTFDEYEKQEQQIWWMKKNFSRQKKLLSDSIKLLYNVRQKVPINIISKIKKAYNPYSKKEIDIIWRVESPDSINGTITLETIISKAKSISKGTRKEGGGSRRRKVKSNSRRSNTRSSNTRKKSKSNSNTRKKSKR